MSVALPKTPPFMSSGAAKPLVARGVNPSFPSV